MYLTWFLKYFRNYPLKNQLPPEGILTGEAPVSTIVYVSAVWNKSAGQLDETASHRAQPS